LSKQNISVKYKDIDWKKVKEDTPKNTATKGLRTLEKVKDALFSLKVSKSKNQETISLSEYLHKNTDQKPPKKLIKYVHFGD